MDAPPVKTCRSVLFRRRGSSCTNRLLSTVCRPEQILQHGVSAFHLVVSRQIQLNLRIFALHCETPQASDLSLDWTGREGMSHELTDKCLECVVSLFGHAAS